ncbi:hypothetical protein MMC26_000176 [Xylographa opegraphella]|nr:hypothetical protein [Xylographa opegraphella]
MDTSVPALVLHGPKDLRIEIRSLPPPAATELQLAIRSTGLCGSDLHYYNHGRNGDIIVKEPLALGHESAGEVVAVGREGGNFQVGDKVALEVGLPCEECESCSNGRYNLCKTMRFRSSAKIFPHFQGTLQEKINHPAKWCYKLPSAMSYDEGAILEPLGVATHASRRAQIPMKASVLVFGAGAVGLLCAYMAKEAGASVVIIADIDEGRVDFATKNGFADHSYVVSSKRGQSIKEKLAIAKETALNISQTATATGNTIAEVDVVFECTGVESCVQAAIYITKPGGRIMLVGMGTPIQTLPISAAALREVDLCGVFRYVNTYASGIELLSKRRSDTPDPRTLITHRFHGLQHAQKAFEMAARTVDEEGNLVLKVVIEMDGKD